ncbi:MAG: quinone oxidoreductase family protein [Motilibacteraceae bacterium]
MRAIQITEFGGPEVLTLTDLPAPEPAPGHVLIQVSSAGVNFADTHQTEDSYLAKQTLPMVPGSEVVGTDPDGRRVAGFATSGGYAEQALVPTSLAYHVPDGVSDGEALALLVQGTTAWHLLRTSSHLAPGETVVVHAAAGGVGTIAVQLAKAWGAGRVIGVASSPEKRALAEQLGADATVDAGAEDLKAALEEANGGRKVDVVLEMVGGETFDASLSALAPFGRLATFGMASRRPARHLAPGELMGRSRTVAGFWLAHCFNRPEMLAGPMTELMQMVAEGRLTAVVGGTWPLAQAAQAHRALLGRGSTGKLVLDCRA